MPKTPSYIYIQPDKVLLMTHHIKQGIITRIRNGYNTVYDIKKEDLSTCAFKYLRIAEERSLPVILKVVNITRLLIFNRPL